ncbi:MAG: hypothetical protein ACW98X_25010, partial [Promethearchaeota archaeon]
MRGRDFVQSAKDTIGAIAADSLADYWEAGNVVHVPLDGDIQTYINNATAGNTLVLASGVYTITDTIEIDKQINIRGQGLSGFVTAPITPSHGTLITSSTANLVAFQINSDNIRLADFSINLTGASSIGVNTANNLDGVVFNNIDLIINTTGNVTGFNILGTNAVLRDLTFYITSSDGAAAGVYAYNNSSTTQNMIVDTFNVTGTAVGGATFAFSFAANNVNDANTITLNLSNSICRGLTGTPLDVGIASTSTTTNNAVVNAYFCTLEGDDYDVYQTGSNELNLGGSILVNDVSFGTVTYRTTMIAGKALADTVEIVTD